MPDLAPAVAFEFQRLLLKEPSKLSVASLGKVGASARALMAYLLSAENPNHAFIAYVCDYVIQTFSSDPGASEAMVRRLMASSIFEEQAHIYAPRLTSNLPELTAASPNLLHDIMLRVFEFDVKSNEKTAIGQSRIFGMSSTRRQDYEMARYQVAESFPAYLAAHPELATDAMVRAYCAYYAKDELSKAKPHLIRFESSRVLVHADYGRVWLNSMAYSHNDAMRMLKAWNKFILDRVNEGDSILERILRAYTSAATVSSLWRNLLLLGAEAPTVLGVRFSQLLSQKTILSSYDTTDVAGRLIRLVFPAISKQERLRIERSILGLRGANSAEAKRRLLGGIGNTDWLSERSRALITRYPQAMETEDGSDVGGDAIAVEWTPREYLVERGVNVDRPENRRVRELSAALSGFPAQFRGREPSPHDVASGLKRAEKLLGALRVAGVEKEQALFGWEAIGQFCETALQNRRLSKTTGKRIQQLAVATLGSPTVRSDSSFDQHGSWGAPAPHAPAAGAIVRLFPEYASRGSVTAIKKAANDRFKPARGQIAARLGVLRQTHMSLMWELAQRFALRDSSAGVLRMFISGTLGWLFSVDRARALKLLDGLSARTPRLRYGQGVHELCQDLYLDASMAGMVEVDTTLATTLEKRLSNPEPVVRTIARLRDYLSFDKQPVEISANVRHRAVALMTRIADLTMSDLAKLKELDAPLDDAAINSYRAAHEIIQEIATQLYFASGAFQRIQGPIKAVGPEDLRFLDDVWPILTAIGHSDSPGAIHRVLETLERFVDSRPRDVFLLAAEIIRNSRKALYNNEFMGAELVVRLIERVMALHSKIINASDDTRQALIDCLDVFADWPMAIRLAYRFEEAFR